MVFFMGIFAMIAGLALLILVHEFGHWVVAKALGFQTPAFSIGFGKPYVVLFRRWNTEFRLSPWLLGGYVQIPEMGDDDSASNVSADASELDSCGRTHKPLWKRMLVAVAGVTMNVLVALAITFALFAAVGKPYYTVADTFVSAVSKSNTIARDAGIQPADVIVAIDGQTVQNPDDVAKQLSSHKGTAMQVTVKSGQAMRTLTLTPNADGEIGVTTAAHLSRQFAKAGVGAAAVNAIAFNAHTAGNMFVGIGQTLHMVPTAKGNPSGAGEVHGVVSIIRIGSLAFDDGLFSFCMMLVLISLNLAVFNILPIPILDGGYLLFGAIEKIRGRPLSMEREQMLKSLFLGLLVLVMVLGLFNDVTGLFAGG